jgi:hypothetical protein
VATCYAMKEPYLRRLLYRDGPTEQRFEHSEEG